MKKYPLLHAQLGVFMECLQYSDSTQYNLPHVAKLDDAIDLDRLVLAWEGVIKSDAVCRNRFEIDENGNPLQWPDDDMKIHIQRRRCTKQELDDYLASDFVRPYDVLSGEPLFRIEIVETEEGNYQLFDMHHTITDTFGITRLTNQELDYFYQGNTKPVDYTIYELAEQQVGLTDTSEYISARQYVIDKVQGQEFVTLSHGEGSKPGQMLLVSEYIDKKICDDFCEKQDMRIDRLFNAAFIRVAGSLTRNDKIVYGTAYHGRDTIEKRNTAGMFVNTIPVFIDVSGELTVRELVANVDQELKNSFSYAIYPNGHLAADVHNSPKMIFNFRATKRLMTQYVLDGHVMPYTEMVRGLTQDDMDISIIISGDQYHIRMESSGAVNTRENMVMMGKAIKAAMLNMIADPDAKLKDISIISDEGELTKLVALGQGPVLERDRSETILSIFKDRVAATPDAAAVVFKDKSYTYAQLDKITDNLAVYLKKTYDIKPEENVGVLIGRSELMLIYPLAIMKNGAAYMPLDPHFPTERLMFMCEDAAVKVILTEESLLEEKLPEFSGDRFNSIQIKELPEAAEDAVETLQFPEAHNRLVIIFTSGSTGKPKAVELEHYGIANYCHWYVKEFGLTMADHVAGYANFGFDAHMIDLYPSILAGSAVYIFDEEMRMDVNGMNAYMEENDISVAFLTTQIGCIIKDINHSLRYLSTGGEKMPPVTPPDFRFLNVYGPTECSLFATYYDVKGYFEGEYIGYPLANYQLYVIDQHCNLVPRGASGELLIAGEGVARGYMNRPELTAEKFILFKPTPDSEPVRAYRSGDLVRWSEADGIQFLGRIDKQVKLRGLRIEPGEVENRAASYPGMKQVVVDVKNDQLCCYYVADEPIDQMGLKQHLSETLTEFMVPEVYMQLEVMPLNANGKVDHKALPEPQVAIGEIMKPETELEEKLYVLAAELIQKENFGVTNNLISLGMSSLAAMRFSAILNNRLGLQIKVADIMRTPTLRELAAFIGKCGDQTTAVLKHVQPRAYYPITENQRGVYIDWEMNRETTQYNMPAVYRFTEVGLEALMEAVRKVFDAHPVVKTGFSLVKDDVVQVPCADAEVTVSVEKLETEPTAEFFQSRVKPFDLLQDPLYRIEFYTFNNQTYLFLDVHHIVADGMTLATFNQEIMDAYAGGTVAAETLTAYDYALYEQELMASDVYKAAEDYFCDLVADANAVSYADSRQADGKQSSVLKVSMPVDKINCACERYGVTASSYFNAAFAEALQRISREENPMYLTISNGREADTRLTACAGMFVKTLPVVLHTENHGKETVAEYVKAIHDQLQETIGNNIYPYTKIVEKYKLRGEVMFIYQGGMMENIGIAGAQRMELELDTVKLPISVLVFPVEDEYVIQVEYDGSRYSRKDMQILAEAVINVAAGMAEKAHLSDVAMISPAQKEEILRLSKGESLTYDAEKTWVDQFKEQAASHGETLALVDHVSQMTYAELEQKSDAVAAYLKSRDVQPDDFVAVKMGRVKEFFVAVLGINKAGAAYVPVDPEYPEDRIAYMLEDSRAKLVLTEDNIAEAMSYENDGFESLAAAEKPAYMIYTSGSTGRPKGVVIAHRGIMACAAWMLPAFDLKAGKQNLHHASFSFDASTFDLFYPLAAGATVHILDEEMRKDTAAIVDYIQEHHITGMTMSTAMGMVLLNQYELNMEYIMLGGEKFMPVKRTTTKLFNGYGPTEFTVCSSYHVINQETDQDIPIGRPVPNSWSFICDSAGNLVPQGVPGELCLAGPQISDGYWQLPEKTEEVFVKAGFMPDRKMYRTGDLARYNEDGNLEYLGRIDFQVKLRGFRIELGEIENSAAAYEGVGQVNAQVKQDQLVLYYTADREIDKNAFKAFLAQSLTSYMVPTIYMQLDVMPMTPGGKIDRRALPEPVIEAGEIVEPVTELETQLYNLVKGQLKVENFGVTSNFLSLGMSSIMAMKMVAAIQNQLDIRLKVADLMKYPTIRELADLMTYQRREQGIAIRHVEARACYPITENQRGIYIDWEMNRATTQYNSPSVYVFHDKNPQLLADAVCAAIDNHGTIKTRFALVGDDVVQMSHLDEAAQVSMTVLAEEPTEDFFQNLVQPFDLFNDQLYRAGVYTYRDQTYLFLDVHHTLYDGLSAAVIMRDVLAAYEGETLKPESITVYDFAVYERELVQSEAYEEAENYYHELLSSATAISYTASANPDLTMVGNVEARIQASVIDAASAGLGVTVSSYLHAAFAEVLQRITREENPLYLTVSNGREAAAELNDCVGMFVKTLPVVLKSENHGKESTADYIKGFHNQLQSTIENDFYPYTALVEKYKFKGEVMFVYQGGIMESGSIPGAEILALSLDAAKFPILITAYPDGDSYVINIDYDGMMYGREDMKLLADTIGQTAMSMAASDKICDVQMVTDTEAKALVSLGTGPVIERDQSETILSIFRDRVAATPDATAVVFKERSFTYRQLDRITDDLAVYLKKQYDIKPEENVGVLIQRSELMLIYPLSVMKNGAAYMPLDPHFPTDRLAFMCEDAEVKVLLSEGTLIDEKLPEFAGNRFNWEEISAVPEAAVEDVEALTPPHAHNRLVIIFTSGSTGKPKAVDLEHFGIVNYCHWYVSEFELTPADHVAGYANFGFDAHMIDLYPSILAGSAVYIFDEALRMDVPAMNEYMEANDISVAFMTTQIGCIIKDMNHSLRYLSTGGEKMPPVTPPDFRFLNVYGPTECSLFATYYDVRGYFEGEYIGYPLSNYQLYVIDQNCQLVPRGVAGELLIAGEGVARGYMNRPELTAEKFIIFQPTADSKPVRAYRSGDLVRWSEADGIQFLGRIDKQVKLRGLRIELGEIENRVASYKDSNGDGVRQVAVDVKNDRLCCYYVADAEIDKEQLKNFLSEKLTDFMIPEIYMKLDVMPLNANGKIDRRALPEPQMTSAAAFVVPETEGEKALAEIMQKMLGLKAPVGLLDNFFELGGDSIKAIRMVSALRQKGFHLQVADIMKLKVVGDIAKKAVMAGSGTRISQEAFEGKVEETAIVNFFKYLPFKEPAHFNQSMVFRWKERPDMELLQKALNAVMKHHDMLRAVVKEGNLYVRSADTVTPILEYDENGNQINNKE